MDEKRVLRLLGRYKRFSLDTSCFIYFFEEHETFGRITKIIFQFLIDKKLPIIVSSITLTELLRKKEVYEDRNLWAHIKTRFLLTPNLEVISPDIFICEKAAQMGVEYNLLVPDAIHVASGVLSDADTFITNDPKFKRVKEIDVLVLRDYI